MTENDCVLIPITLRYILWVLFENKWALVCVAAWSTNHYSSQSWLHISKVIRPHLATMSYHCLYFTRPASRSQNVYHGPSAVNTLRPRQNGRRFADDTFKRIFLNENVWMSTKISLKFVPKVPINNIPALVQIMAWRRPGDNPLSEPMLVSLLTHKCVTRPHWVKWAMLFR